MQNPALECLTPLIGSWTMDLYGASFLPEPNTHVTGTVQIDWIEGGAAIAIRQSDSEHPPAAVWIIGKDDDLDALSVLYSDDRGVSRLYHMSFASPNWRMWRTTPDFAQRFDAAISSDGRTIKGSWKKSFDDGHTWEHDFNLDYTRSLN